MKKRCRVCGAGPEGLRSYESSNRSGCWVVTSWICAEWKVPCHRRHNAFGRDVQRRARAAAA